MGHSLLIIDEGLLMIEIHVLARVLNHQ